MVAWSVLSIYLIYIWKTDVWPVIRVPSTLKDQDEYVSYVLIKSMQFHVKLDNTVNTFTLQPKDFREQTNMIVTQHDCQQYV